MWRSTKMTDVAARQVWLIDGPAAGRIMLVETNSDGELPEVLHLPQTGVFMGSSDEPAPTVVHTYGRQGQVDNLVTYEYARGA